MPQVSYAWAPQPGPQLEAIMVDWCPELFFGGARGGGKSEYLIGDYLAGVDEYGPHFPGLLVRRSYPELQDLIARAYLVYSKVGAEWREGKHEWHFPQGAVLRMRHVENFDDAMRQQGFEYAWIGADELPQWVSAAPYLALFACLRYSRADVPKKRIRATGNPGGPGHQWVKARFIDPAPGGFELIKDGPTHERMFIPSRVQDNKILLAKDPGYIDRLRLVGSKELVRAWLEGDWNIVQGAYFDNFTRCIIEPVLLAKHLMRFRSFDYGGYRPFSVGWWAVADGSDKRFTAGDLIRYREWYGAKGPNEGLKLTIEEIAAGIALRSEGEEYAYSVADPAIFAEQGGPSIAEVFRRNGILWRPADNKRIPGWQQIRDRLGGKEGRPAIWCFTTCTDSIRTIPALQHDMHHPEDVDTEGEDHAADDWRYGAQSRPYVIEQERKATAHQYSGMRLVEQTLTAESGYRRL